MSTCEELVQTKEYAYIWLQRLLGIGSATDFEVLRQPTSPQRLCRMTRAELKQTGLFAERELARLDRIDPESIAQTVRYCRAHEIRIITPEDAEYPDRFREIESPPVVLYARGLPLEQNAPAIAIVGTRKSSEFGDRAAYSLSARLAASGFTVVSGGALGIDRMAQIGAMNAGGNTVVILGCGIDSGYLRAQEPMRKRAERQGTVLSEMEPKTPAARYTFPVRNRLISALSGGVAVIEAGHKSGALITATYAMEQGREIFAVPGNIDLPQYAGTNELIRDGAVPLLSAQDIVEVYIGRFPDKLKADASLSPAVKQGYAAARLEPKPSAPKKASPRAGAKPKKKNEKTAAAAEETAVIKPDETPEKLLLCSAPAKRIYEAFAEQTELSDVLSARSGISGGAFIAAVTELELNGLVTAVPVGRYCKK